MEKANNLLLMSDWEMRKFIKIVVVIQLVTWGLVGSSVLGLEIPILTQIIGFIYVTFVPGMVLLRVFKIHRLCSIDTLLLSVGLSISFQMFIAALINALYPLIGISNPISAISLLATTSVVLSALTILSYLRDTDFAYHSLRNVAGVFSLRAFILCLLPCFSILGVYLVNFGDNNQLLMLLIALIAAVVVLIGFDFILKELYPLAVLMIAISLLYHRSLISMYLTGYDIHSEYYFSNLVRINSIWDSAIPNNYNAMLSIVMLAPIYSNILRMDLTWVFKVIYPLLFSLVPLGLYQVFKKLTDQKIAFLSCFFFMSMFTFYGEMLSLARQQIAELFLVLLIMLIVSNDLDKMKKSMLSIIFGSSLIVSHYGLSYVYLVSMICAWLILVLTDSSLVREVGKKLYSKFGRYDKTRPRGSSISSDARKRTTTFTVVLLFTALAFGWYIYVSSSSVFETIVSIGNHISNSIFKDFLGLGSTQGLYIVVSETVSPLHSVLKYLFLFTQLLIFIGVVVGVRGLLSKHRDTQIDNEYVAFAVANLAICVAGLTVPYFASSLNTSRLYHMTLIFLAPFFTIGWITVLSLMGRFTGRFWTTKNIENSLKLLSLFLVIFFLFNSGFVYEIAKDYPTSISLSKKWFEESGDIRSKLDFYSAYIPDQDVFGVRWLSKFRDSASMIYADLTHKDNVLNSYGMILRGPPVLSNTTTDIEKNAYIYLGYSNVVEGIGTGPYSPTITSSDFWNMTDISSLIDGTNKIYTNGYSEVYRK